MKTLLALLLLLSGPLAADWREELAPGKPGHHPPLAPVTLHYTLSWKGMIDAGSLTFSFGRPDPAHPRDYRITASGGSSGLASKLFPYKVNLASHLDPVRLRPRRFRGIEVEGDELTVTESTFYGAKVRSTETNRPHKAAPERKWTSEFRFAPAFDAFSAILQVRSQPLKAGDSLSYALVPFNTPYLVSIRVLGRERHLGRDAIKLAVSMRKIDPKSFRLVPYKKLKSATLWISDDADRIPLELRSEVFIGDVRMSLREIKRH
jgi:hypothetical protein